MHEVTRGERIAVLGVNGVVGRAMARKFLESKALVFGLDVSDKPFCEDPGIAYQPCDATAPSEAGLRAIAEADTVVVCLPEDTALAALPTIVRQASVDSLIVDTLSVKERVVSILESLRPPQEYLSINPMFSPSIGFSGQNVAVVKVNDGPRAARFISLLESWGAGTVAVTAEEHDRLTALIQVATHAAIMSIGLTLHDWGYDVVRGIGLATPPHRICLALLARMSNASPEVYWDIQRSNAYGADARKSLLGQMTSLSEIVEAGEEERFCEIMTKIADVIRPRKSDLLQCADSISAASSL